MGLTALEQPKALALLHALNAASQGLTVQSLVAQLKLPPEHVALLVQTLNEAATQVLGRTLIVSSSSELTSAATILSTAQWGKLDLLNTVSLWQQLHGRGRLSVLAVTDSTNSLLERCLHNCVSGDAVVSELQTAARGRRGNRWQLGMATQLSLSLVWKFNTTQETWGLPLLVALAVVEALSPLKLPLQIKWPNDLYLHDSKLCGILVELHNPSLKQDGGVWAVIGIGLNVYADAALATRLAKRQIAALGHLGSLALDRTTIAARIINALRHKLQDFACQGFGPFVSQWEQYDYLRGRQVVLELDDGHQLTAVAVGTDKSGRLLLDTAMGRQAFASGHIVKVGRQGALMP